MVPYWSYNCVSNNFTRSKPELHSNEIAQGRVAKSCASAAFLLSIQR